MPKEYQELERFISVAKSNHVPEPPVSSTEVFFTLSGGRLKESSEKVALLRQKDGVYYVRGNKQQVFFDPWADIIDQKNGITDSPLWIWVRVSKKSYEMYKDYLLTKNAMRKRNAERENITY